jgi:hypothetical protein
MDRSARIGLPPKFLSYRKESGEIAPGPPISIVAKPRICEPIKDAEGGGDQSGAKKSSRHPFVRDGVARSGHQQSRRRDINRSGIAFRRLVMQPSSPAHIASLFMSIFRPGGREFGIENAPIQEAKAYSRTCSRRTPGPPPFLADSKCNQEARPSLLIFRQARGGPDRCADKSPYDASQNSERRADKSANRRANRGAGNSDCFSLALGRHE